MSSLRCNLAVGLLGSDRFVPTTAWSGKRSRGPSPHFEAMQLLRPPPVVNRRDSCHPFLLGPISFPCGTQMGSVTSILRLSCLIPFSDVLLTFPLKSWCSIQYAAWASWRPKCSFVRQNCPTLTCHLRRSKKSHLKACPIHVSDIVIVIVKSDRSASPTSLTTSLTMSLHLFVSSGFIHLLHRPKKPSAPPAPPPKPPLPSHHATQRDSPANTTALAAKRAPKANSNGGASGDGADPTSGLRDAPWAPGGFLFGQLEQGS